VQTLTPDHPCIALAAAHDYDRFVAGELGHRKDHNYPPYHRLARIIVRSREQEAAANFSEVMAGAFNQVLGKVNAPDLRLLGPAEAPIFRLKGYYRYHFQLQSPSAATLHQVLRSVLPSVRPPAGVEYTLDVDPFQML
jgi:primosomal protein N' (replication factor Y)